MFYLLIKLLSLQKNHYPLGEEHGKNDTTETKGFYPN